MNTRSHENRRRDCERAIAILARVTPRSPDSGEADLGDPPDAIEARLTGQPLKLYVFLRGRKYWATFDTLRRSDLLWKRPQPNYATVHRALRNLQAELNVIAAPVSLLIDSRQRKAKLDGEASAAAVRGGARLRTVSTAFRVAAELDDGPHGEQRGRAEGETRRRDGRESERRLQDAP